MSGLLDKSSSDCFLQTTTQTDKKQTETKVVPVFGRLLTALWQRRNCTQWQKRHWTLVWEPCCLLASHSSDMPLSPMLWQFSCWLASKPDKPNGLCNTQRLQEVSALASACGRTSELRHCLLKGTTTCNTNTDYNNKKKKRQGPASA